VTGQEAEAIEAATVKDAWAWFDELGSSAVAIDGRPYVASQSGPFDRLELVGRIAIYRDDEGGPLRTADGTTLNQDAEIRVGPWTSRERYPGGYRYICPMWHALAVPEAYSAIITGRTFTTEWDGREGRVKE